MYQTYLSKLAWFIFGCFWVTVCRPGTFDLDGYNSRFRLNYAVALVNGARPNKSSQ